MLETLQSISNVLNGMWNFCTTAWDIITNPSKVLLGFVDISYWVLLLVAIVCLILTMSGCKKTRKGVSISMITYVILKCLASVLV